MVINYDGRVFNVVLPMTEVDRFRALKSTLRLHEIISNKFELVPKRETVIDWIVYLHKGVRVFTNTREASKIDWKYLELGIAQRYILSDFEADRYGVDKNVIHKAMKQYHAESLLTIGNTQLIISRPFVISDIVDVFLANKEKIYADL